MNNYKATPHNPPLTHAGVKVSMGSEKPETKKQEKNESLKVKAQERQAGID